MLAMRYILKEDLGSRFCCLSRVSQGPRSLNLVFMRNSTVRKGPQGSMLRGGTSTLLD